MFEQITLLRAHHDQYTNECQDKVQEAEIKINQFDRVKNELEMTARERDELIKANSFIELKLTQQSQLLAQIEDRRRND